MIAIYDQGCCIVAKSATMESSNDALMADALGCMMVFDWAKEKNWEKVIMETDCLALA